METAVLTPVQAAAPEKAEIPGLKEASTIKLENPPQRYEGNKSKTDVLNRLDGDMLAVPFKLREGTQDKSLSFKTTDETSRIIIPEDIRDEKAENAWALQKTADGKLSVRFGSNSKKEYFLTKEELSDGKCLVLNLNEEVSLGVTGYNPETDEIQVFKITNDDVAKEERTVTIITDDEKKSEKPKRRLRELAIPIIGTGILASEIAQGLGGAHLPPVEIPIPPPPIIENAEQVRAQANADLAKVQETPPVPEQKKVADEWMKSLKENKEEDEYVDYIIQPGEGWTHGIVNINGREKFLDENGELKVDELYTMLWKMFENKENYNLFKERDPEMIKIYDKIKANNGTWPEFRQKVQEGNVKRGRQEDDLNLEAGDHTKVLKLKTPQSTN